VEHFNCASRGLSGFGLSCKHETRLERLARDKHSNLLEAFANYGHKIFTTLISGFGVLKHFS
jgi:hypothetical protein